jgi:hypothetical protein
MDSLRLEQIITIFKWAAFGWSKQLTLFNGQPSAAANNHHSLVQFC